MSNLIEKHIVYELHADRLTVVSVKPVKRCSRVHWAGLSAQVQGCLFSKLSPTACLTAPHVLHVPVVPDGVSTNGC